jgi:hypothetical protein
MSIDLHIVWEIKNDDKDQWTPLGKENVYGYFDPNKTSLENNFMGLILNGEHLCGWYRDNEVPIIHKYKNGCPSDSSFNGIEDYFTKTELESFDWENIIVPFDVAVTKEDYERYKNGADPIILQFATAISGNSERIQFDLKFKDHFKEVIKELNGMKKYKDYRLLVYYE